MTRDVEAKTKPCGGRVREARSSKPYAACTVTGAELEKTTPRMLGKDAPPNVEAMSPAEIAAVREGAGISQAILAGFMNVAVKTVSQWERGERHPTGAALKLLHVVKQNGLDALR